MKIYIASDHAGFELKTELQKELPNIEWVDLGPISAESVDYPDFAAKVALEIEKVQAENDLQKLLDSLDGPALGVLICGSGQGMAIKANRYAHVRAALCWNSEIAGLSREHNNANILCMGARFVSLQEAVDIFKTFFQTRFAGGRHQNRVAKLTK